MSVKLNEKYLGGFVAPTEIEKISHLTKAAYSLVKNKNGAGSDFLGWVDLPVDYDKEEFARIKAAAEKIKKMCDVFVVIGIGGSYLGAVQLSNSQHRLFIITSRRILPMFISQETP